MSLVTAPELAALMKRNRTTIYKWARCGHFPKSCIHMHGRVAFFSLEKLHRAGFLTAAQLTQESAS